MTFSSHNDNIYHEIWQGHWVWPHAATNACAEKSRLRGGQMSPVEALVTIFDRQKCVWSLELSPSEALGHLTFNGSKVKLQPTLLRKDAYSSYLPKYHMHQTWHSGIFLNKHKTYLAHLKNQLPFKQVFWTEMLSYTIDSCTSNCALTNMNWLCCTIISHTLQLTIHTQDVTM